MNLSQAPATDGSGVEYGLQASITDIPAGYSLSYIVATGQTAGGAQPLIKSLRTNLALSSLTFARGCMHIITHADTNVH